MGIEYIPFKFCDPCKELYGKRVNGETYRLLLEEPNRPRVFKEVELCETEGHNTLDLRMQMVSEYGRHVQKFSLTISEGTGHNGALLASDVEEVKNALSNGKPKGELPTGFTKEPNPVPVPRTEEAFDTVESFDFDSIPKMEPKARNELEVMCLTCEPSSRMQHSTKANHFKKYHEGKIVEHTYTSLPPRHVFRCECGAKLPAPSLAGVAIHSGKCPLRTASVDA